MDIWEDEDVAAACEDDVDPPERTDRTSLGGLEINLLGVNYRLGNGNDSDYGEGDDEDPKHYAPNETISGQMLDFEPEEGIASL